MKSTDSDVLDRILREREEEEEEDDGDSGSDWGESKSSRSVEYEESDSAGSDMEVDTRAFGAETRKRKGVDFTFRAAKSRRLLKATALPTVNELMKYLLFLGCI